MKSSTNILPNLAFHHHPSPDYHSGFTSHERHNIMMMLWSYHLYTDLVEPVNELARSESYCYKAAVNLMPDFTSVLYLEGLQERETKADLVRIDVIYIVYLRLDQFCKTSPLFICLFTLQLWV